MNGNPKLPKLPRLPRKSRAHDARCAVCGCRLAAQNGSYAGATVDGRSHVSDHHYVAKRFFANGIFEKCPWGLANKTTACCYECHEVLLHNPVFTESDIERFSRLVAMRGLNEDEKPSSCEKLAGRIQLLHGVIDAGLRALLQSD